MKYFYIILTFLLSLPLPVEGSAYLTPDRKDPDISVIAINSFAKGQNDRDKKDILSDAEAVRLYNGIVEDTGIVRKRTGTATLGDDVGNNAGLGIGNTSHITAGNRLLVAFNTIVYKLNSTETAWTSISTGFTAGLDTYFLNADNYVFIMNGTDRIRYYNPSAETVTTFGAGATDPPLAKHGIYTRNRTFLVDEANPSRLRYSDSGDVLTYQATSEIPINEDDGQRINALIMFQDALLIFKSKSIWSLNTSEANYITSLKLERVENNYGTLSPQSVWQLGNDILFLDQYGDLRNLGRTQLGSIRAGAAPFSDTVRGTLDKNFAPTAEGINRQYINKVASCVWKDKYFMAYPDGTSTYNTRVAVWNARQGSWSIITGWNVAAWTQFTLSNVDFLIYCEASSNSLVFKCFTGTGDNGTAIDFDIQTKEYTTDWMGDKEWQLLDIITDVNDGNLDISVQFDSNGWNSLATMAMEGNSPRLPQTLPFNLGNEAEARNKYHLDTYGLSRGIQFRLRNNTATDNVTVRQLILFAKLMPYYKE